MAVIFSGVISLDAGHFRTAPQAKNVFSVFRAAHESSTGRYWATLSVRFYDTVLPEQSGTIEMEKLIILFVSISSSSHYLYCFHIIMMLNLRARVISRRYIETKKGTYCNHCLFCVWNIEMVQLPVSTEDDVNCWAGVILTGSSNCCSKKGIAHVHFPFLCVSIGAWMIVSQRVLWLLLCGIVVQRRFPAGDY